MADKVMVSDVEELHHEIADLCEAIAQIFDCCEMEPGGEWLIPIFIGGHVQANEKLSKAISNAVTLWARIRERRYSAL